MNSIIQELYSLTLNLQQDNRQLLELIQHYSSHPRPHNDPWSQTSLQKSEPQIHQNHLLPPKAAEATSLSRISKTTVKQTTKRCKSSQSLKHSRTTEKFKVPKRNPSPHKEETVLSRLKKVGQVRGGKVGTGVLIKKKSKIYHFETHY